MMGWKPRVERVRTVGILGVGRMGLPVAKQLIDGGFSVVGYRRGSLAELVAIGGRAATSFAQVARESDAVISLLPDAASVSEACDQLVRHLRPGSVLIDMATLGLGHKNAVREALAPQGIATLDCPISGGPMMLPRRENVVLGSGEAGAFEHCRPLMETLSTKVLYLGAFGAGSRLKFVAQHLVAIHNLAAAEALSYAEKSGLDLKTVIAAIVPSVASSRFFEQRGPLMAERRFTPAAGPIAMLAKDLSPVLEDADAIGAPMPLLSTAYRYYEAALAAGMGALDVAAMIDALDLAAVTGAQVPV